MTLTTNDVQDYIDIRLGGSDINVDLQPEDYEHIVVSGLRVLGTGKPAHRYGVLAVSSGVQKYTLDAGTWGFNVIKVQRPLPSSPLYYAWPLPDPYTVSVPVHFLGDYVLGFTEQKEAEYLFGADFDFSFDRKNGVLYLRPPPLEGGNYVYVYLDYPGMDEIGSREQWFLDYSLAIAKMIVGSKWRKFRNFPGNENQVELHTEIYDEGMESEAELRAQIERVGAARMVPMTTHRR